MPRSVQMYHHQMPAPTYQISQFHWDTRTNLLTAEASELQGPLWGRLYDDACDAGIKIHSPTSGRTEMFYLLDTHDDAEGDVSFWEYAAVRRELRVQRVFIYND